MASIGCISSGYAMVDCPVAGRPPWRGMNDKGSRWQAGEARSQAGRWSVAFQKVDTDPPPPPPS